jgi:predicted DNA-binding antitoxin AbrB/MazE fold protein
MLLTFQGVFENGKFIPSEPVTIPEHKRAIVTILEETDDDRKKKQLVELDRLWKMLDENMDEEVPEFTRANLHREVET